ncbi:MAG: OmpA family protein [Nitrospira sp.]|nr:OmpA family protein [Nitrospira sp.]
MNSRLRFPGVVLYLIALAGFTIPIAETVMAVEPSRPVYIFQVPLVEGLTIVIADRYAGGDFELIKTVTSVDAKAITVTVLSDEPTVCAGEVFGRHGRRRSESRRAVLREDMERAHAIRFGFTTCVSEPEFNPGTSAINVSSSVLRQLKAEGQSNLSIMREASRSLVSGVLTRIERGSVSLKVIVNDKQIELAAIHARWHSSVADMEYWILDDVGNPLMLRAKKNGKVELDVVKLSFPTGDTTARLERDLSERGRTVTYGIYFDSASDRIKEESERVLKDIADVMTKNPAWKLSVEGHTDNLGGDAYNVDLAKRRAAAVKQALVEQYKIDEKRLHPAGFGASKPKDTNETLQGRALNRRVELVRIGH